MTNQPQGKVGNSGISSDDVISFLRTNPDFFSEHEYLLKEIKLPHASGKAVSLVQRQMSLLREERDHYHSQLMELIDTARENGHYFEKSRRLLMNLLDAGSINDIHQYLEQSFVNDFQVDFYSLVVFARKQDYPDSQFQVVAREEIEQVMPAEVLQNRQAWCGQLEQIPNELIFGERAGQVKSSALVPVKSEVIHGLLSIGSKDPDYFHSRLDSVFLTYISESLGKLLPAFIHDEAGS